MNPYYLRGALLVSLLAVLLVGNTSPMIARASATAPQCGLPGTYPALLRPRLLNCLAFPSMHSDAWAVGVNSFFVIPTIYPLDLGIVEHWDGTR